MHSIAISGVNRGIGEGAARTFLNAGWRVYGIGRSAPDWFSEFGETAHFINCDMSLPNEVAVAASSITDPLDVLLCNAASFGNEAFHLERFSCDAFLATLATNLVSPIVLARSLRDKLLLGRRKLIIMMSTGNASISGNIDGGMLAYRCSKSGLNQAVRNMAAEWRVHELTTIALNPGWVRTDMGGPSAPLTVQEANNAIFDFVTSVAAPSMSGCFVNPDGSPLPW